MTDDLERRVADALKRLFYADNGCDQPCKACEEESAFLAPCIAAALRAVADTVMPTVPGYEGLEPLYTARRERGVAAGLAALEGKQ